MTTPLSILLDADIDAGEQMAVLTRLSTDVKEAAKTMTPTQMRWLVDTYYSMQEYRKSAANQIRAQGEAGEPNQVVDYIMGTFLGLEKRIVTVMKLYAEQQMVGRWSLQIPGIGPVIAAGLLAHIDITKAPTAGHIWSYAGLNPDQKWEKGQKRPWNARLKVLGWKIGESFVKVSGRPQDIYGHIYAERKEQEQRKNEQGAFAEQAEHILKEKKVGKDTIAHSYYSKGQLPPAHIHARAKRYAVKLFLSHWQYVAWEAQTGQPPAQPYVLTHLGHVDFIKPPLWPLED